MNNLSEDYEERKAKLGELYDIFSNILLAGVNRELRLLRRNKENT